MSDLSDHPDEAGERLRLAIDAIPAMVWTMGPDGRVEFLNQRWREYTGLSLEEALQNPQSTLHPDDYPRVMDEWRKRMAKKEPYEGEMRLRRADGKYLWFLVRTVPLLDLAGNVVSWYGSSLEIEGRKQAVDAIRENQQLLTTVLETLPVGVVFMDTAGNIHISNAASRRIWGGETIVSGAERLARAKGYWHDSGKRLAPGDWASARTLVDGRPVNQLVDIESFDGRHRTIQNASAPLRDDEGRVTGAIVVMQDLTERVNAEEALRDTADRLQQLSRRLLAVQEEERRHLSRELHDEFGQLLSAISMHLQVAKSVSDRAAWSSLADCDALVQRAGERVRMLALELRPSMLDGAGLDGTLRWLAEQHSRQGRITVNVAGTVSDIPNDVAITCFRIVQEALTNVSRHAYAAYARIQLQQEEGSLRVAVEDDGVGFDVAAMRGNAAATGHLGLTGMRERAEILGGHFDVESRLHVGTRVSVRLPLPANGRKTTG